eukprot:g63659.t1
MKFNASLLNCVHLNRILPADEEEASDSEVSKGSTDSSEDIAKKLQHLSQVSAAARSGLLALDSFSSTPTPGAPEDDQSDEKDREQQEQQEWDEFLLLDWIVTAHAPPHKCVLLGPGRHLMSTTGAEDFQEGERAVLAALEISPDGVSEDDCIFELIFIEEDDIDAVATKKEWKAHPGKPSDAFLLKHIMSLVEPHKHAANGRWNELLPTIPLYKGAVVRLPQLQTRGGPAKLLDDGLLHSVKTDSPAASDSIAKGRSARKSTLCPCIIAVVSMESFKDPTGRGKGLKGYTLQLIPRKKSDWGKIGLREDDVLDGTGKLPLLEYHGD